MTALPGAEKQIDGYLERLRVALRSMPSPDVDDILRELRSHLAEVAKTDGRWDASAAAAAITRLGDPMVLAEQYQLDQLAARAQSQRSPVLLVRLVARWAARSVAGLWALLIAALGYSVSVIALGCAVLKPFYPERIGLWVVATAEGDPTFQLGRVIAPMPGARELLGWFILPLGLIVAVVSFALTTRYLLRCAARIRHKKRPAAA